MECKQVFNISSIYPNRQGARFDFDYYLNAHMPLSIGLLSNAKGFRGVSVERGVEVVQPPITSSYVAMCHYYFDTLEDFMAAFMPHAEKLQSDIVNYTDITPIIQINEVAHSIHQRVQCNHEQTAMENGAGTGHGKRSENTRSGHAF